MGVKRGVGFLLKRVIFFSVYNKESALEERNGKGEDKVSLLIKANFFGTTKWNFAGRNS